MKRTIRTVPRIRTIKPEFFKHEKLFDTECNYQLPLRVAFIGLITCCDREGRFRWQPRRLKSDILPFDEVDMRAVLDALVVHGFIKKYEHEGEWYGCIPSFLLHQRINSRESKSILPAPEGFIQAQEQTIAGAKIKRALSQCETSSPLSSPLPKHSLNAVEQDNNLNLKRVKQETPIQEESPPNVEALQAFNTVEALTEKLNINNTVAVETRVALEENCSSKSDGVLPIADADTCTHMRARVERKGKEGNGTERNGTEGKGTESEEKKFFVASQTQPVSVLDTTQIIFEHWKTVMNHPNARLDPKRKKCIAKSLKLGYAVEDLKKAISGCSLTPYNMGDNVHGQRFDGLQVILRDADQIDRFVRNYHAPPRRLTEAQQKLSANEQVSRSWLESWEDVHGPQ